MMKKLSLTIAVTALLLSGCKQQHTTEKIEVYTTVFPFQSFIEQIGGKYVDVKSIYPNGIDVHTFEPTQQDTLAIAKSDLFIYTSKNLDPVSGKIAEVIKDDEKIVAVAEDLKQSTLLEHHDHDHHPDESEPANDPHVWLDPVLDQQFALNIKNALIKEDPQHKAYFDKNYKQLAEDLKKIDKKLKLITTDPKQNTIYISHESLGYLAQRYHFNEVGVSGMNNDEPSQQEIVQMVNDINNHNIPYVLYEQNIPSKITDIIKKKTGTKALKFHNMSVLTDKEADNKEMSYQKLMEKDIKVINKALNH